MKTLTLDEILADHNQRVLTGRRLGKKPGFSDSRTKQAFLQWIADKVVGGYEMEGYQNQAGWPVHRNELRRQQLEILKAEGWEPEGK